MWINQKNYTFLQPLQNWIKKIQGLKAINLQITFRSSDDRNPPNHMKHLSAGVFHMPESMWNTSDFAPMLFSLNISS